MDNPVDSLVDLGLVNYVQHPTNPDYVVYRFGDENRAESFAKALDEAGINYERGEELKRTVTIHLFGIHKLDYKKTVKINYIVEAQHKKPLIPFRAFRWFLILFSAMAMTLAIVGYCKQQETLRSYDNANTSINQAE